MLAENCVFGKQSPEPLHCALPAPFFPARAISTTIQASINTRCDIAEFLRKMVRGRDPLLRTYGVKLPSSLRTVLSSALGYSPCLPVSVLVRICAVVLFEVFLGRVSGCSGILNRPLRPQAVFMSADLPTDHHRGTIATTSRLPAVDLASPPQFKPSVHSAGILTCCPSSTPFGLN